MSIYNPSDDKLQEAEPEEVEELELEEKFDKVLEHNHAYHFEGENGFDKLEDIAEMLGYDRSGFKYGEPVERMICDNPGMQEAMVQWLRDNIKCWKDQVEEEYDAVVDQQNNDKEEHADE